MTQEVTAEDRDEAFIEAILESIMKFNPTLDEVHAALVYILADVMNQIEPTEIGFKKLSVFTADMLHSAVDFQNTTLSDTLQ